MAKTAALFLLLVAVQGATAQEDAPAPMAVAEYLLNYSSGEKRPEHVAFANPREAWSWLRSEAERGADARRVFAYVAMELLEDHQRPPEDQNIARVITLKGALLSMERVFTEEGDVSKDGGVLTIVDDARSSRYWPELQRMIYHTAIEHNELLGLAPNDAAYSEVPNRMVGHAERPLIALVGARTWLSYANSMDTSKQHRQQVLLFLLRHERIFGFKLSGVISENRRRLVYHDMDYWWLASELLDALQDELRRDPQFGKYIAWELAAMRPAESGYRLFVFGGQGEAFLKFLQQLQKVEDAPAKLDGLAEQLKSETGGLVNHIKPKMLEALATEASQYTEKTLRGRMAIAAIAELKAAQSNAAWLDTYMCYYHTAWILRLPWPAPAEALFRSEEPIQIMP